MQPSAVAKVYYRGIGNKSLLRQPSLKATRTDKTASDLADSDRATTSPGRRTSDAAESAEITRVGTRPTTARAAHKRSGTRSSTAIKIRHPERVVFSDDGITKQEVAEYYAAVMLRFLPGVVNRPTSVIRCPEGTAQACFFQKHALPGLKHVGNAKLKEESGAPAIYIYPLDADSVIELVQFGVLEFHPWGSTVAQPDRADRVVFDLDPGDNVVWGRVITAARLLRKLLAQLGLTSFVRTTGGKGLHVVVPLNPACAWPGVKSFAHAFAASLAQAHPLEFLATASKAQRSGKIYVDYLRNTRGATSIASYSLRARRGAPVAVPLRWSELGKLKSGHDFNIHSAPKRLARLRSDPWQGIDDTHQNLDGIMRRLAQVR